MASKKFLELKEFSSEDLANELVASKEDYNKMRLEHAVKGLDNPLTLRELRKDVARLQTEIRRRELAAMSEAELANRSKIRHRRRK
jgi:large subunit ribosomal protein L29